LDDHSQDGAGAARLHSEARHLVRADPRADRQHRAVAGLRLRRGKITLSRFHHGRARRRQARPLPDNWIYIHEPCGRVGRIQNFRSWSPEMVPDARLSCLGLEYFCFEGDGLWTATDEQLIALAKRELAAIGLASEDEVRDGCVVRQKKAYPVYDEDYKAHIETIRDDIAAHYPTLHLVGRNGMHKYNNQDHAMMTAMLTVRNILAGEPVYDVWNVNEDAEYHEAGVSSEQEALKSVRQIPRRVRTAA
jgi:hypothetical protein